MVHRTILRIRALRLHGAKSILEIPGVRRSIAGHQTGRERIVRDGHNSLFNPHSLERKM